MVLKTRAGDYISKCIMNFSIAKVILFLITEFIEINMIYSACLLKVFFSNHAIDLQCWDKGFFIASVFESLISHLDFRMLGVLKNLLLKSELIL